MLDHVTLKVSDLARSAAFYDAALKPLGISRLHEEPGMFAGFGVAPKPFFWIGLNTGTITGAHVAITALDHATVDAFYKAAMSAGAADNGKPGLRPHYHANYYGAFVLDPDGHNIEAVCHHPAP
jgi:catechol 2,3-dioxygenase-like lactoylglutathione lyase family enzyme